MVFTLLCVVLGWVVFRSTDLHEAKAYLGAMVGRHGNALWDDNATRYLNDYKILLLLCILFSTPLMAKLRPWLGERLNAVPLVDTAFTLLALGLLVISVSMLVIGGHNPFIYFNF
ncbi:MAG: hypothetical protein LUC43_03725 [Burkholderiales bacterium]|nr:hypothetical protein [Burkholderiales bacterium]